MAAENGPVPIMQAVLGLMTKVPVILHMRGREVTAGLRGIRMAYKFIQVRTVICDPTEVRRQRG